MASFLTILLIAAMAATLITLLMGIIGMVKTDKNSPARSNQLMRWRIYFQAIAVIIFGLLLLMGKHS